MQPWDSFIKKNTLSLGTSSLGQPASSSISQAKSDFAKRRQIELETAGINLSNIKKENELSEANLSRKQKIAELNAKETELNSRLMEGSVLEQDQRKRELERIKAEKARLSY